MRFRIVSKTACRLLNSAVRVYARNLNENNLDNTLEIFRAIVKYQSNLCVLARCQGVGLESDRSLPLSPGTIKTPVSMPRIIYVDSETLGVHKY